MADDPSEDQLYEFAPEVPPKRAHGIPRPPDPKPNAPVTLSYLAPKNEPPVATDTDTIKNVYMPLGLLAGGVVIEVVAGMLRTGKPGVALGEVAVQLVLGTVAMLGGIFAAAKFRGIKLGQFWTVVFKLAAISVGPSAIVDLVNPILRLIPILGGLLGFAVQFILYFALLGALFDLDESDTWFCVMVIFLVDLAVSFGIAAVAAGW